jgi:intraflagellar transport protein 122
LWTKKGIKLTSVATREDWIWSAKPRPKQNYMALGCNDGTIAFYQLIFNNVLGLYQEVYGYRDFMTEVVIQNLVTEQKLRIRCKDYVKKIAIYKDRLAVQLPSMVSIYEKTSDSESAGK